MSEQEHAVPASDIDRMEGAGADLSQLTELARQAYHQKRTKNCLDLVKAILVIDPENAEAQLMRSSIRLEMHLDLENARALLRDAHLRDRPQMYSEAGSTVLRKILSMDPESEEARTLLSEVEASTPNTAPPPASLPELPEPPLASAAKEQPVTAVFSPGTVRLQDANPKWQWIPAVMVIISVALAVFILPLLRGGTAPAGDSRAARQPEVSASPVVESLPAGAPPPAPAGPPPDLVDPVIAPPAEVASARPVSVPEPRSRPEPVVTVPVGRLAISSPTSVDIYRADQYIGSAPITIDISPGTYTFEYRHAGMVKTMTHVISSSETTRAMISFDIPVQINAKPWADVFIEGTQMTPLGQTPMSSVRVPIGGTLVFQNSQFPAKRYRVTGRESTIQIVFP